MADYRYSLDQVEQLCRDWLGWRGEVTGNGEFICYCPIHGDSNASLHVGLKGGAILIRCLSHNCDSAVYKYLSENKAWPQQHASKDEAEANTKRYERRYPERAQNRYKWNSLEVTHQEAVKKAKSLRQYINLSNKKGPATRFTLTSTHIYTNGEFAQCIISRYDAAGHAKRIIQYSYGYYDEHEDPNKPTNPDKPRWQAKAWDTESDKAMIYALTYVESKPDAIVVVVEGEKAADYGNTSHTMPSNMVFTTWKGGAQAVNRTDWAPLKGRNIILWPDNDEPGFEAMNQLAQELNGQASVKVIKPDVYDLPKGFDVADYPSVPSAPSIRDLFTAAEMWKPEEDIPPDQIPPDDPEVYEDWDICRTFWFKADNTHLKEAVAYFNENFIEVKGSKAPEYAQVGKLRKGQAPVIYSATGMSLYSDCIRVQMKEKGKTTPVFKMWNMREHRRAERVGVNPRKGLIYKGNDGELVLNMWLGFDAERRDQSGSCERLLNHLRFVCSGEENAEDLYNFLIIHFARMVQTPWHRQGIIPVLRGNQGSGKSIIGDYLGKMIGEHATVSTSKKSMIFGDFNSQLRGAVLVNLEEVSIKGGNEYDELKDLATKSTFMCNEKGRAAGKVENFMHFIITGNRQFSVPVVQHERRMMPIDVPDTHINNRAYFDALVEEMEGGGPAALFKYLKEVKLPESFLPLPNTRALLEQKNLTRQYAPDNQVYEWYAACLYHGALISGHNGPDYLKWKRKERISLRDLSDRFLAWSKGNNKFEVKRHVFTRAMADFMSGVGNNGKVYNSDSKGRLHSTRSNGGVAITLPDIRAARTVFRSIVADEDTYPCEPPEASSDNDEDDSKVLDFNAPF